MILRKNLITAIPVILAVLILSSCNSGNSHLIGPGSVDQIHTPEATIENLWPAEDGYSWFYELAVGGAEDPDRPYFDRAEDVPGQPSMEQVIAALADEPLSGPDLIYGAHVVEFDGMGETDSGARGKQLVAETTYPLPLPEGAKPSAGVRVGGHDLFGRSLQLLPGKTEEFERVSPIHFVGDGIWGQTEDYIGYHNHLDQTVRFRLAVADLSVGSSWSIATVPSIAPHVFLHAQVLDRVDVETPRGNYVGIVRVLYVFDLGVVLTRDPFGGPEHFERPLLYSIVDYAPTIGPVHFRESRAYVSEDEFGEPVIGPPTFEIEGTLLRFEVDQVGWPRR